MLPAFSSMDILESLESLHLQPGYLVFLSLPSCLEKEGSRGEVADVPGYLLI